MKLIILTVLSMAYYCNAYSGGAPKEVCNDMTPKHPVDPQKSPLPYKITVNKNQVKGGQQVAISINGRSFKGLLVQVRKANEATGEFVVSASDKYFKTVDCHDTPRSALTHKNSADKINKTVVWKAPTTPGKYTVHVTVAEDGETFWANVPTQVINVF
ncbi:unnamed protein product [Phyllotreta striolata]|uniref:Reelin domain-containing protein n=1 Tax=Phyllotreta striolata TaxID=444603 RepID=A0A9N9TDQ0_PHYSR|nr:unnamed protein product [Phyllotreta striolata]